MRTRIALAALALFLLPAAVRGDTIAITFNTPVNQALPPTGGTIIVQGRLTNTSGDAVTIERFGVDFSAQIGSFESLPLVSTPLVLLPGETTGVLDLFFITGSPSTSPGDAGRQASGQFSLVVIGWEGGRLAFIGRSEVVNVGIGFTPTPEPATLLLLGTGIAGVGAAARRRRKAKTFKVE